ncbi:Late transcription factor VLTF-4 (1), partial [Monkeypox virus]
KVKTCKK